MVGGTYMQLHFPGARGRVNSVQAFFASLRALLPENYTLEVEHISCIFYEQFMPAVPFSHELRLWVYTTGNRFSDVISTTNENYPYSSRDLGKKIGKFLCSLQSCNQLGTLGGAEEFSEGLNFCKLCSIVLIYVQHIFPGGRKNF